MSTPAKHPEGGKDVDKSSKTDAEVSMHIKGIINRVSQFGNSIHSGDLVKSDIDIKFSEFIYSLIQSASMPHYISYLYFIVALERMPELEKSLNEAGIQPEKIQEFFERLKILTVNFPNLLQRLRFIDEIGIETRLQELRKNIDDGVENLLDTCILRLKLSESMIDDCTPIREIIELTAKTNTVNPKLIEFFRGLVK